MTVARTPRWRTLTEPWLFGLVLGATVGFVVLGVGGRIAMRAIALDNNTPPGFSVGGTATVVFLGVLSGVGGGLLYVLLQLLVPRPRFVRSALFGVVLILLTLRGLRPIQPLALEWFMPLALGYGALIDVVYTSWSRRRARTPSFDDAPASRPRYSGRA
jgi:hypothetical protein